ncbi:MAG TPA: hypothetical protein VGO48_10730 [Conexibacter sp.]|jgi:hypothetical protein|nr:hypothetical protein [Conexibacter sp.]
MRIIRRKSRLQRLRATVEDSLAAPLARRIHLLSRPSGKTAKAGLIAAGGLTGLTAGSAGISSLRRRSEGAEDDS